MELYMFIESISNSVKKMNVDIEKLYSHNYVNNRQVLDHLNREVMMIENIIKYFETSNQENTDNVTRSFSLEELALFNGKNGYPAYVAINGVVYNVTNNAAWAAATHFGLSAGRDLTNAFATCHAGANILNKLPVIGILS